MRWRWIEISPTPMRLIGVGKIYIGRAEETEAHVGEALRLSPRDTLAYVWMTFAGLAKIISAVTSRRSRGCRRSIEANRNYPPCAFSSWPPRSRSLVGWTRRVPRSRPGSRSTRPSPSPALRAAWTASSDNPTILPSCEPHSRRHAQGRGARAMTATRRLAAIMAVDVVGYSRLMGEDEAGTARAVREHREAARPIVAGFGGRIVKTMGDGLLLEFPSVVAAVECAIAIQKLMAERNADVPEAKRIVYRIGVNLGDVLIEGDDILGDGVNIAARLEGICEPGGVLISGTAYDHVRGKIDADFVDLGEKDLKNIARPVRVYAVKIGARAPRPRPPPPHRNVRGRRASRSSSCRSPISAATRSRSISSTASRRA